MRCSKEGCDWEGELGDLERHLSNKCLYAELVCSYGCGQLYPRHLLQSHQLDECPQRHVQHKLEAIQIQVQQLVEQTKKDKRELQQQLAQQEKELEMLQQQLIQQEKTHREVKELNQKLEKQLTGTNQ